MFDTLTVFAHPTSVLTLVGRLPALALAVVLAAPPAGVCAGWLATPEARMACCAEGCPMSESESESGVVSTWAISQAEADRCCAASERDTSTPRPSAVALSIGLAIVPTVTPLVPAVAATPPRPWREHVPTPLKRIPTHLLLSVLIV